MNCEPPCIVDHHEHLTCQPCHHRLASEEGTGVRSSWRHIRSNEADVLHGRVMVTASALWASFDATHAHWLLALPMAKPLIGVGPALRTEFGEFRTAFAAYDSRHTSRNKPDEPPQGKRRCVGGTREAKSTLYSVCRDGYCELRRVASPLSSELTQGVPIV